MQSPFQKDFILLTDTTSRQPISLATLHDHLQLQKTPGKSLHGHHDPPHWLQNLEANQPRGRPGLLPLQIMRAECAASTSS